MNNVFAANKLIQRTKYVFEKHPLVANSCTGFFVFSVGDIISQVANPKVGKGVDYKRSLYTGVLGIAMNGACLHVWYRALDRMFGSSAMQTKKRVVLKCIADQLIFAPFSIAVFFSFASAKQGGSLADIYQRTENKMSQSFTSTWIADCTLWPFANFINFSYVPLPYRPTFTGITQLIWQSYMSTVANSSIQAHKEIENSAILLPPSSENRNSGASVSCPVGSQVLGESPLLQNKYR
jgi:protein Mpv17